MKKLTTALFSCTCAAIFAFTGVLGGCGNDENSSGKAKYRIELASGDATVEVGSYYTIPVAMVFDASETNVTEEVELIVSALDPKGDDAFIDETTNHMNIDMIGEYKVTFEILDEDIEKSVTVTGVDTQAPVITGTQNFKSDVFKGETVTLPKLITEDASGIDTSKTKFEVYEGNSTTPMEIRDGEWEATSLEGYTIKCYVTDKSGISATRELKIRVTEKWLDADHLKGRELATFGDEKYLSNVKGFGEKPSCDFSLAVSGLPAANADNGYGSSDGKALKVTLKEGAKRERSWFRVWLPRPFKRTEVASLACKIWSNATIDQLWIYNSDLTPPDAEAGWDASSTIGEGNIEFGRWSVLETPQWRLWEDTYQDKDIEYLDFAVWYSSGATETPVLYLDEIFYDTFDTQFKDTTVVNDKVAFDFDEVNTAADGRGNPTGERKYEDTVKFRGNILTGCRRMNRWFVDADDATEGLPAQSDKASGKVLKMSSILNGTACFLMFPTDIAYNPLGIMSMNIFVNEANFEIVLRGYAETNTGFKIEKNTLKAGEWNTVEFPMSIFSNDVSKASPNLKGMYLSLEDAERTHKPVYIDNIVVTDKEKDPPADVNLYDFSTAPAAGSIVNLTKNGTTTTTTCEVVSGDKVPAGFTGGALKCVANKETGDIGCGFYLYFAEGISREAFTKLTIKIKTDDKTNFMNAAAILSPKDAETVLTGDNAIGNKIWADADPGEYTFTMSGNNHFTAGGALQDKVYGVYIDVRASYTATCTFFIDFVAYSPVAK